MQSEAPLAVFRTKIDIIDGELVGLLNQRAKYAQIIGEIKGGEVCDPLREAQVLQHVQLANQGPLSNEDMIRVFQEIIAACRALQDPNK